MSDAGARRRAAVWGTAAIVALGSVAHFVYDWSGRHPAAAALFPVNESVWEHTRMATWPGLIVLAAQRGALGAALPRPARAFAAYVVTAPPLVAILYYAYTGALGLHGLPYDIAVFVVAVAAGQAAAMSAGAPGRARPGREAAAWVVVAFVAIVSVAWTWRPPHLPVFRDGRDGSYGIPAAR